MHAEKINAWPTVGWEIRSLEGTALTALCLIYRSDPRDRSVQSKSLHFALSVEQLRMLAGLFLAAADEKSLGTSEGGTGRH